MAATQAGMQGPAQLMNYQTLSAVRFCGDRCTRLSVRDQKTPAPAQGAFEYDAFIRATAITQASMDANRGQQLRLLEGVLVTAYVIAMLAAIALVIIPPF